MSGTIEGGRKARATNIKRHGEDFYARIGKMGGQNSHTGGFASRVVSLDGMTGPERARIAGAKGGRKSKRGPAKPKEQVTQESIHVWQKLFRNGKTKIGGGNE